MQAIAIVSKAAAIFVRDASSTMMSKTQAQALKQALDKTSQLDKQAEREMTVKKCIWKGI